MSTHTPGPWELQRYTNYEGFSIWAKNEGCIAERWYTVKNDTTPIEANARLIAAAPDLLQSLKDIQHNAQVMNQAEPNAVWSAIDDVCCKAIAKAEGRQ